ncbi:MAG: hypothetical protein OXG60_05385 [Chloroflexi bacterium]|nr:hypothetical protein [Chloroflexota bacterium]
MLRRFATTSVAVATVLCALLLYLHTTTLQSRRNSDLWRSDQHSHIEFARKATETRFAYTGDRNFMPLFAFLQAALNSPELDDEAFFERGKQINIWLSIVAIACLGIIFYKKFSRLYTFYAISTIGFLAFAFKAPFFQPEVLYYTLFSCAFILSVETLFAPKWYKSVAVGALFALAYYTKASALPSIGIFSASYAILLFAKSYHRQLNREKVAGIFFQALAPLVMFFVLLFPYFHESKIDYGKYFYNVNTSIYMWMDSWREAKAVRAEIGGEAGFIHLPDDEIPSLQNYLRKHSVEQIFERLRNGSHAMITSGCLSQSSMHFYGYCSQVALGIIVFCVFLPVLLRRFRREKLRHLNIYCYIGLFFTVNALGAFWYTPISGPGPRIILALLIPFFWTLGLVLHSKAIQDLRLQLFGYQIKLPNLLLVFLCSTLFYEIIQVATWRAAEMYGGK